MAANKNEASTRKNQGVCVNENDFQASSEITGTEMETEFNHQFLNNFANEADHSSVSIDADHSNSQKSTSDNEANCYRMKTSSRKGLKERPSVVTFQQWNPKVTRHCYKRRFPHVSRRQWDLPPQRPSMASRLPLISSNTNYANHSESYPSSDRMPQPRSLWSKLRLIFSRSRCVENADQSSNVDIEKGQNTEFYHFDHGESTYYRVTDNLPHLTSDLIAQRVHDTFTRFWAEVFGYINLVVTFIITFLIQFFRFILYGIFQALFIGVLQTTSDYLLKPTLAFLFNGFLQPIFTLFRNILQSISEVSEPLAKMIGDFLRPFTECVRAFRIMEVKNLTKQQQPPESRFAAFQAQSN